MIQNVELFVTVAVATVIAIVTTIFFAVVRHRERMELSDKYYKLTKDICEDILEQIALLSSIADINAWRMCHRFISCNIRMANRNNDQCISKRYQKYDIEMRIAHIDRVLKFHEDFKIMEQKHGE